MLAIMERTVKAVLPAQLEAIRVLQGIIIVLFALLARMLIWLPVQNVVLAQMVLLLFQEQMQVHHVSVWQDWRVLVARLVFAAERDSKRKIRAHFLVPHVNVGHTRAWMVLLYVFCAPTALSLVLKELSVSKTVPIVHPILLQIVDHLLGQIAPAREDMVS